MVKKHFFLLFVMVVLFALFGILIKHNPFIINRAIGVLSNQERLPQEIYQQEKWNSIFTGSKLQCDKYSAIVSGRFYCHSNKPGDVNIFIIGDSHAEHLFFGLNNYLGERYVIHAVGVGGCPPFATSKILSRRPEGGENCKREYENVIEEVINSSAQIVILSSLNSYYLSGLSFGEFVRNVKSTEPWKKIGFNTYLEYRRNVTMGFDELLEKLIRNGKRVIFVNDIPHMLVNPYRCFGGSYEYSMLSSCAYHSKHYFEYESDAKEMIGGVLAKYPSVAVVDPSPIFCRNDLCSATLDGTLLYRDKDHLSLYGSLILGAYIGRKVLYD